MNDAAAADKPSFFTRTGQRITKLRNFVLNSVFVLAILLVFGSLLGSCESDSVPEGSALVINPRGALVEQTAPPVSFPDVLFMGGVVEETAIGDVLDAISYAADDDDIKLLLLNLDELSYASSAQSLRIGEALASFKESGKQVVAYADYFSQYQYHIASYSDALYMHPMGQALLTGYGGNNLYFREMLQKLSINVHVFRVGDFKSAVEPFTRDDMSDEAKLANKTLYGGLWNYLLEDIARNRQIPRTEVETYSEQFSVLLQKSGGDMARAALEAKMVDELLTRDQVRSRIADQVGWIEENRQLNAIGMDRYLRLRQQSPDAPATDEIAVLVAQGTIMEGDAPGIAAADALIRKIRDARFNDQVKALVLRVDSPGGSAFASELIRQELELLQLAGKPVVASFASVAASGGYWISATADAIVSEATTITGSIGIFGVIPTFENSLDRLGIHSDGVGTSPLGNADSLSGLNDETKSIFQSNIEFGYQQFLDLVARGRNMETEAVEEIAQGRVWQGDKALELGLVDALGDLDTAIEKAAE
ncbi:MAG: signal peptide peptidase SppA, partial [Pseudomonadota bacterium]|nr:signal peptide peptidase SppA [Pseudomonadota bacterium]